MRVLLANKFFYDHGGPESVLFLTRDLLLANGHEVVDFAMRHPRNRPSPYAAYFAPERDLRSFRPSPSTVEAAVNFVDSREAATRLRKLVRDHRPDVAHLHSISHQLTPSIIRVLRDENVPVVMTLHDYKLVCPAYTLTARGHPCERCRGGRFYKPVTTRCRGLARGVLFSVEAYAQHRLLRSYDGVSLFLSPSQFLAGKFREMGFHRPIEVLPNPTTTLDMPPQDGERGKGFVFVGRLVTEKGLRTLCSAATHSGALLSVVGGRPEETPLRREFGRRWNIDFLGRMASADAQALMSRARAVVLPAEWYENQPMVILEAFAASTPVIASDIGGIPELVRDGETGLLHRWGDVDDLADKLRWAMSHPAEMAAMGRRARAFVEQFSPQRYYSHLLDVYGRVGPQHAPRIGAGRRG